MPLHNLGLLCALELCRAEIALQSHPRRKHESQWDLWISTKTSPCWAESRCELVPRVVPSAELKSKILDQDEDIRDCMLLLCCCDKTYRKKSFLRKSSREFTVARRSGSKLQTCSKSRLLGGPTFKAESESYVKLLTLKYCLQQHASSSRAPRTRSLTEIKYSNLWAYGGILVQTTTVENSMQHTSCLMEYHHSHLVS